MARLPPRRFCPPAQQSRDRPRGVKHDLPGAARKQVRSAVHLLDANAPRDSHLDTTKLFLSRLARFSRQPAASAETTPVRERSPDHLRPASKQDRRIPFERTYLP